MRILGIDPGLALIGYGIIEAAGSNLNPLSYGCISTKANDSLDQRLKIIYNDLLEIIKTYKPDVVAIEELFFAANVKTAILVGEARGVIILSAANLDIPIIGYTPLEIKQAITGYGHADKKQIQYMVKKLLKLDNISGPDDVSDGLAVAICHSFFKKMNKITNSS